MTGENTRRNKMWTDQEEWYLQENWGKYSIPTIANNLGRSLNAVKVRAQRLGLGPALMGGDYIVQFLQDNKECRYTIFSGCYDRPYPTEPNDFCSYGERRTDNE